MTAPTLTAAMRCRRLAVGLLAFSLGAVAPGCAGLWQTGPPRLSERREREIAEMVKRDPFPTAAEAGVSSAGP